MAEETQDVELDQESQQEDNLPKNIVEMEDVGKLKKKVAVTVLRGRIDAKLDEMFGELRSTAQVPGFRIGRVPRRLIEKRFGKEVGQDVRNALVGESIGSAIEEAELKTLGEPSIDLDKIELPDSGDMTFSFEVEIEPQFDLPEIGGIEVKRESLEVNDERTEEYIQTLREAQARYEKTDAAAQEGDAILTGAKITGEGVTWENPRVQLRVAASVIEGLPLVDLGPELTGKKTGDTVTLKTTAAQAHPNEEWRGKELTIELTIHEVSRRILPEFNDEFASARGFDSLGEFRTFVADRLKTRVQQEVRNSMRNQICQYLLDKTDFELPEGLAVRQTQRALQRQYIELLQAGVTREKIDENLARLQAVAEQSTQRNLKLSFILGKIADQQGVEVSDGEINTRVAQIAAANNRRPERVRQELAADGTIEQVGVAIREEKTLDKLLKEAKIVDVPVEDKVKEEEKDKTGKKAKAKPKKTAKKTVAKKAPKKTVKKTPKKTAKKSTGSGGKKTAKKKK